MEEKYKFVHFGAGDLLRAESKKDTEEGKLVKSIISQGKIVPVAITCRLIKKLNIFIKPVLHH